MVPPPVPVPVPLTGENTPAMQVENWPVMVLVKIEGATQIVGVMAPCACCTFCMLLVVDGGP